MQISKKYASASSEVIRYKYKKMTEKIVEKVQLEMFSDLFDTLKTTTRGKDVGIIK